MSNGSPPAALILAAGGSRRFWPLSTTGHKSLFELAGVSLLERTVRSLAHVGVKKIVILQSPRTLYSGPGTSVLPSDCIRERYDGTEVSFLEQPIPAGQGDAILRSAEVLGDSFLVVQPENINAGEIALELLGAASDGDIAVVAAKEREDFSLYAVIEHDNERLLKITEKPSTASTEAPLCGTGVYLLHEAFIPYLVSYHPDPTSLILALDKAAKAGRVSVARSRHEFLPLKYPGHLWAYVRFLGLNLCFMNSGAGRRDYQIAQLPNRYIASRDCLVGPGASLYNAILAPEVVIGAGTRTIPQPVWDDLGAVVIGEGATIGSNVTIAPSVRIGSGATVASGAYIDTDVPDFGKLELACRVTANFHYRLPGLDSRLISFWHRQCRDGGVGEESEPLMLRRDPYLFGAAVDRTVTQHEDMLLGCDSIYPSAE